MSDILFPGNDFSTFEKQDKVLVGVSGGWTPRYACTSCGSRALR